MNEADRDPNRASQEEPAPEVSNEAGGLFSDDYEVKRENPYLRKNRSKPEPAPKPLKPSKTTNIPKTPRQPSKTGSSAPASGHAAPMEPETGYRRRRTFSDFLFEHVKLFVAILSILLVISLVIITDLTGMVDHLREKREEENKLELTMKHVQALTDRGAPITWSDMARFQRYNTSRADNSVTWYFEIPGTVYEVWISGVDTEHLPTYVYLYDLSTGDRMDLNKDDLDRFLDPALRPEREPDTLPIPIPVA